jgi:hypothetical protein
VNPTPPLFMAAYNAPGMTGTDLAAVHRALVEASRRLRDGLCHQLPAHHVPAVAATMDRRFRSRCGGRGLAAGGRLPDRSPSLFTKRPN